MGKSKTFVIACGLLLFVQYLRLLWPLVMGGGGGAGVGLEGIARVAFLGIIVIILIDHLSRFSFVFRYENKLIFIIVSFLFLIFTQFFLVDYAVYNLQGSVKFLFYFGIIMISLYGAIVYSDQSIHILLNICLFMFLSVLIFYPYVIAESGESFMTRLLQGERRLYFLLRAGNEDAHFMTTLAMLAFVKMRKYKILCIAIAAFFYVALIYNGTRSALMLSFILPVLFYILLKRKFITSSIVVGLIVLVSLPTLTTFLETKFEKDLAVLEKTDEVMEGEKVEGNLSWRIAYLWMPTVKYTLEHSPIIGNGSNGFDIVAVRILKTVGGSPHNFFVWSFVNWGAIGLILVLALMGTSIRYIWQAYWRDKDENDQYVNIALLCAWMEFIVWSLIANSNNDEGWTIICILVVFSICVKYKHFSRDLINTYESFNRKHA